MRLKHACLFYTSHSSYYTHRKNAKEKKRQGAVGVETTVPFILRHFNAVGYRLSCSLEVSLDKDGP